MEETKKVSFFGIFVWSLAILFFFFEFFLRIFLGTIATEFQDSLNLTIRQFSIIAAGYYVTYGLMQIPVGILTEKIGARIILTFAALVCTIGVFFLSLAEGFYSAFVGRLLIGFGSSFAFVSLLILALNWFPKKYFGFLCGISLFLGAVGPLLAGAPLAYVNQLVDGNWRLILDYIGGFGIVLTIALLLFLRNKPKQEAQEIIFLTPHEPLRQKLGELLRSRQAWYIVLFSGFLYCTLPTLAAYFGTSYLQLRGFDKTSSAFMISMVWIGYAAGNPLMGKASDYLKRRTPFLYLSAFIGCVTSLFLLFGPSNNYFVLLLIFFILGFASSAQGLAFALIVEHTPKKLNSAALGFTNSSVMLTAAVFPSIVGSIIQAASNEVGSQNLTPAVYVSGLSLIPLLYAVAGVIAIFLIKESYCRQQHEVHKLHPLHKASDLL